MDISVNKLKSLFAKALIKQLIWPMINLIDFINEFERLYNNIKKYVMELPTGVLAYRLLKSAEISEDKQQLARATITSFSYDCMKRQLKTIYDDLSQESSSLPLKLEPVYELKTERI